MAKVGNSEAMTTANFESSFFPKALQGKETSKNFIHRVNVEELAKEALNVRLNRYIAYLAGLPTPPGKKQYI